MKRTARPARTGFTLIELIVVMTIIAILAAIVIAFWPSMSTSTQESRGAQYLQQWLTLARQRAVRNEAPYGVRLYYDNTTRYWVINADYIEQPDDFAPTGSAIATGGANATTVNIAGADPTGGFADPASYTIQPGDFLEILGTGLQHRITAVSATSLTIATPITYQLSPTANYRILRQARLAGEEKLDLPQDIVVDMLTNFTYGNQLPARPLDQVNAPNGPGSVDVLFAPSGAVITPGLPAVNTLNFWVRNSTNGTPFDGEPSLIAVYTKTGFAASYPVARGGNPYTLILP